MQIRYFIDPTTELPHIYQHDVSELEVEAVLARPLQTLRGRRNSQVAIGQTEEGRYLKVIYVPDAAPNFVVTAYELGSKAKRALRRKRRKKK